MGPCLCLGRSQISSSWKVAELCQHDRDPALRSPPSPGVPGAEGNGTAKAVHDLVLSWLLL